MIQWNNKLIRINGGLCEYHEPPAPPIPSDMDFVYLAKDFDGRKIPNKAVNSTFGDYIKYGTLTVNNSGASCYLSNGGSDSNYLMNILSPENVTKIQGVNNVYTFFIRMMQDTSTYTGGIMSTRLDSGGYNYMIRCASNQLQIHTTSGINLGSDFSLAVDRVYKVVINGASFYAKNLDTNAEYNRTASNSRSMGSKMTSFNAGYRGESYLDRFYAFAGIARATTAEEDAIIKDVLMNQSI